MKHVVYHGPANRREISAADFSKAGVEVNKDYTFFKGQPLEVNEEVAKALLEPEKVNYGRFIQSDVESVVEVATTPVVPDSPKPDPVVVQDAEPKSGKGKVSQ